MQLRLNTSKHILLNSSHRSLSMIVFFKYRPGPHSGLSLISSSALSFLPARMIKLVVSSNKAEVTVLPAPAAISCLLRATVTGTVARKQAVQSEQLGTT